MKPEDNNPVNEQNLDADLDSIGQVYHRAPEDEPPDLLDQAILNKARLATEVKRSGWHFGGFRWISAFATASVVVVSLALVMEQVSRPPMSDGLPAQPSSRTESYELDVISADDANEIIEAEEAIAGAEREAQESRARPDQPSRPNIENRAAAEGAAAPAPALAPPMPAQPQKRNDVDQKQDEFADQRAIVAEQKAILEKSEIDADTRETARDAPDVAAEPMAESELGAITVSGSAVRTEPLPPDVWIKQIIHWKHMQLNERFEREFAEFRKVYPDYELPDELANIVREGE